MKLASHGADVVINYHSSAEAAESVAAKARDEHGVRSLSVKADVSSQDGLARLFETAKKELGKVDIVMSNSGIEHFGSLEEVRGEEIDKIFAVNVKAQYFVAQQAHKYLEKGGRLILMSSVSAVMVLFQFFLLFRAVSLTCRRVLRAMQSTAHLKRQSQAW